MSSKTKDSERRSDERRQNRWEVEVPLATSPQKRVAHTVNVSRGGLMFSLAAPARLPAALELTVRLPSGQTLLLPSEVRHLEPAQGTAEYVVGVQFQESDARRAWEQALDATV